MYFAGLPEMTETEEFELLLIHKSGWRQELFQIFGALKKKDNKKLQPNSIISSHAANRQRL